MAERLNHSRCMRHSLDGSSNRLAQSTFSTSSHAVPLRDGGKRGHQNQSSLRLSQSSQNSQHPPYWRGRRNENSESLIVTDSEPIRVRLTTSRSSGRSKRSCCGRRHLPEILSIRSSQESFSSTPSSPK